MQTDPLLRTCRISEKIVRFLMFFGDNRYRGQNCSGSMITDKKRAGNRVIPVPLLLLRNEGYISSLLFHRSDDNGNGLS